ncbi:hypothetical protein GCM10009601_51260 [Streptomyces thermospinosisporus]|jgi:hypothetical protein|uniref:Uncharacterized protein n=1 Tax=Streptomyces thermospinosisporus TaxID=161482 RepID=A0ABN1Z4Q7_9ACTN
MAVIQPALDGSIPSPAPERRRIDDYDAWVDRVRPVFLEVARSGEPFLFWEVAHRHRLPDPPDRDHDWGRLAAQLHREGVTRTAGFGLTRDRSGVRRWRGTAAARDGRFG